MPVLVHGSLKLSQSGVILDYLAEQTRKFGAKSDDERREILRWILFDNHKFTSYIATLRFLVSIAKTGETPVTDFLRQRAINALKIVDLHLGASPFIVGKRATIADISMCGYLFFGEELAVPLEDYPSILKWLDRIRALPGWKHPYDLLPKGPCGLKSAQLLAGDMASRYSSRCSRFSKRIQPSSVSASTVPSESTRAGRPRMSFSSIT